MAKVTLSKDSLTVPTIIFNNGMLSSDESGNLTWNGQQVGGGTLDASGDITFTGLDTFTQYVTFNGGMISNGDIILNGSKLLLANGASVELYTGDGVPLPEGGVANPGTGNSGGSIDTSNFAKLNEDNIFTGNNNFTGNLELNGKLLLNGKEIDSVVSGHNVGEQWISMDGIIPMGGLPFLGQTVLKETYSDLYAWAESNKRFKTEAEWQSLYTANNGNVSFYAKVDDNTFRLPSFKGYLKANESAGGYTKEGLPNITGYVNITDNVMVNTNTAKVFYPYSGAFHQTTTSSGPRAIAQALNVETWADGRNIEFSAQKSNSIYGNSSHVTPETNTILVGVYAFNTIINPSNLDVESLRLDNLNYVTKVNGEIYSKLTLTEGREAIFRKNGARLYLCSLDDAEIPGDFILRCPKNENCTDYVDLRGNKNGVLTWGGKHVLTENSLKSYVTESVSNVFHGYRIYSDGWIEQYVTVDITNSGVGTFSWAKPFTKKPYALCSSQNQPTNATSDNNYVANIVSVGSTNFTVKFFDSDSAQARAGVILVYGAGY